MRGVRAARPRYLGELVGEPKVCCAVRAAAMVGLGMRSQ
jgi:hypothetical protein